MPEPRRRPTYRSTELRLALTRHPKWPICTRQACGWPVDPAAGETHPSCEREEARHA